MRKSMKIILSLSILCFLVIGVIWGSKSSKVYSESKSQPQLQDKSGPERINEKARAAKGSDREAIESLTAEIMSQYGWDNAPPTVRDSVKDRLVRAEEKFNKNSHKGVSEIQVARAINALTVKFKTPEYTKTSPSEVREVRGRLLPYLPELIGRGRLEDGKEKAKKPKSTIEEMSPVEAAYITMTVLHQKLYNPEFQLTQEERRAVWVERHSRSPHSNDKANSQTSISVTGRQQEIEKAFGHAISTMPLEDLLSLPNKVLDALKIER